MSRPFELACRSLALGRWLAGLTIIGDLIWRSPALGIHYTDEGIWPLPDLVAHSAGPLFPSPYFWVATRPGVAVLFLLHGLAGAALALGYRTQASTALCWFMTRSLHARQPTLLNGGDHLFAMLLFWGMFVPWGSIWSLDSRGGRIAQAASSQQRLACALFALQLPWVYWVAFFHKLEPLWLRGEAVRYALESSFFARPAAAALLAHPAVLKGLDYAVMGWEALGPCLLLSPWARARVGAALVFVGMHLGMACFLRVGLFAWTPCLFLIALMPDEVFAWPSVDRFWSSLASRAAPAYANRPAPTHRLPAEARPFLLFLACLCLMQSAARKNPPLVPSSLRWVEVATGLRQDWTMFTGLDQLDDGWLRLQAQDATGETVELLGPQSLAGLCPEDRWAGALWKVALDPDRQEPFARAMVKAQAPRATRAKLVYVRKLPAVGFQDPALQEVPLWEGPI